MAEIKKNVNTPPIRLCNEIIKLSMSNEFIEATKEWRMKKYYYVKGYKACLCSPRGIHNVSLIVNKHNNNELEICNSCAKLYFKIHEGVDLEYCVRKINTNTEFNMTEFPLQYMEDNKITSIHDTNCYNQSRGIRNDSMILYFRREINKRMLLFTDYDKKEIFDKLDRILVWMVQQRFMGLDNLIKKRYIFLTTGEIDVEELNSIINENCIGTYDRYLVESTKEILMKNYEHLNEAVDFSITLKQRRYQNYPKTMKTETKYTQPEEDEYWFPNGLQAGLKYEYDNMEKDDDDEYDRTEELIMNAFTEQRCHTLYQIIYDWTVVLMQRECGISEVYNKNSYIMSSIPIDKILDFIDIQKLHEVYNQTGVDNIYTLLLESDLPIDYTYDVLGVLIKRSDETLKTQRIGKLNRLLREIGLKLLYRGPSVKFISID